MNGRQVVATADEHLAMIYKSNITHVEMIVITEYDTKYRKSDKIVRDIDNVNQHLAVARLATIGDKDEVPITSENVEIYVLKEFHPRIRALLQKNGHQWCGNLGHIHATTHRINLVSGVKQFKAAPYRAGQTSGKLAELEIKRRFSSGVI